MEAIISRPGAPSTAPIQPSPDPTLTTHPPTAPSTVSTAQLFSTPLRMDQPYWYIPLQQVHTCSTYRCSIVLEYDLENRRITSRRSFHAGRCPRYGSIEACTIALGSYTAMHPPPDMCHMDSVVIPDRQFTIQIGFPLIRWTSIAVNVDTPITLRELLHLLQGEYQRIYVEESETASETSFPITRACPCQQNDALDFCSSPDAARIATLTDPCAICYSVLTPSDIVDAPEDQVLQCPCGHAFHTVCLNTWLTSSRKNTCPMCRQSIQQCANCSNTGRESSTYVGTVLPPQLRTVPPYLRNETDGQHGIYKFDLDMLYIDSLFYNRLTRTLYIRHMHARCPYGVLF